MTMHFRRKGFWFWKKNWAELVDYRYPDILLLLERTESGSLQLTRKAPVNKDLDRLAELPFSVVKKIYTGQPVSFSDLEGTGLSLVSVSADEKHLHFNFHPDVKQIGVVEVKRYEVNQALETLIGKQNLLPTDDEKKDA